VRTRKTEMEAEGRCNAHETIYPRAAKANIVQLFEETNKLFFREDRLPRSISQDIKQHAVTIILMNKGNRYSLKILFTKTINAKITHFSFIINFFEFSLI